MTKVAPRGGGDPALVVEPHPAGLAAVLIAHVDRRLSHELGAGMALIVVVVAIAIDVVWFMAVNGVVRERVSVNWNGN